MADTEVLFVGGPEHGNFYTIAGAVLMETIVMPEWAEDNRGGPAKMHAYRLVRLRLFGRQVPVYVSHTVDRTAEDERLAGAVFTPRFAEVWADAEPLPQPARGGRVGPETRP